MVLSKLERARRNAPEAAEHKNSHRVFSKKEEARRDHEPGFASPELPRILVIEDHLFTRLALVELLRRRGFEVDSVADGTVARKRVAEQHYDLIVSDIGLPDADGYELMQEFHSRLGLKGIAVTGHTGANDIARSLAAGFLAHVAKPVRIQALHAALMRALEDEPLPAA